MKVAFADKHTHYILCKHLSHKRLTVIVQDLLNEDILQTLNIACTTTDLQSEDVQS